MKPGSLELLNRKPPLQNRRFKWWEHVTSDSDIDLMVLLNVPNEEINAERKRIYDISDKLDLDYDVVLTPVFQSYPLFQKYMSASVFYQNVQREGVRIA